MNEREQRVITPERDPWDPLYTRMERGRYELTSIEFTVTHLCNLRCEHCAVGEDLAEKEGMALPVDELIRSLDEVDTLQTVSFTGGEPILNPQVVRELIQPLLRYCKDRGIRTQLNSNLTLPLSRYLDWVEDLDVMHISYNYRNEEDFYRIVFKNYGKEVSARTASALYQQMVDNAYELSKLGVFVSAESFLSPFTSPHIVKMHQAVVEMGCKRHEVNPLYPSDFAKGMKLLNLDELRAAIRELIKHRNPDIWLLFGTLPFYPCSEKQEDLELWTQLHQEPRVTVRQDPDGRSRLNVNSYTGDVIVTDFGDIPPLGNIRQDRLSDIFDHWLEHPVAKKVHCFCPEARCTGPNLLLASEYYPDWNFEKRSTKVTVG